MAKVHDFEEGLEHTTCELICIKCGKRWIGVFPTSTLLKDLDCPACKETGWTIKTGQDILE